MEYVQELTLDLNSNNAYPIISAKQGDTARYIRVKLTKDNIPYDIDSTHSFYFRMRKPDGYGVISPAQVVTREATRSGPAESAISVQLSSQALAVAGRGYADLVEYDNENNVVSTEAVIVNIMAAPDVAGRAVSSDDFQQLNALVSNADTVIGEAEAWAQGTVRGVPAVASFIIADALDANQYNVVKSLLYEKSGDSYVPEGPDAEYSANTTYYYKTPSFDDNNARYYASQALDHANEAEVYKDYFYYATATAQSAEEATVAITTIDAVGTTPSHLNFAFGLPRGDQGIPGISPTVSTATIVGGTQVNITYGNASTTSFEVYNGKSGVAVSTIEPTNEDVNVWIDPAGTLDTSIIDAQYVIYDASNDQYSPGTVGASLYELTSLPARVDRAEAAAEAAATSAESAATAAEKVSTKITNPTSPQVGQLGILVNVPQEVEEESVDNISWTTTLPDIGIFDNAPKISKGESEIALIGTALPNEFGLAPANTNVGYPDGSYYSKPSNGIFDDLTIAAQNKINNTYDFITKVYYNSKNSTVTTVKCEVAEISNLTDPPTITESKFIDTVNYKIGTYTVSYDGTWTLNGPGINATTSNLSDWGLSLPVEVTGGERVTINYEPYAMLQGLQTDALIKNVNFLDNAWFSINQRGIESYGGSSGNTIVSGTYFCDRWMVEEFENNPNAIFFDSDRTVTIDENGLHISEESASQVQNSSIVQILNDATSSQIHNQSVTISAAFYANAGDDINYSSISNSFYDKLSASLTGGWKIELVWLNNRAVFRIVNTTEYKDGINIRAVKVELGNTSTLKNDVRPNYDDELLKCQRYYIQFNNANGQKIIGHGFANSASALTWRIPLSAPMVNVPALSVSTTAAVASGLLNGATTTGAITGANLTISPVFMVGNMIEMHSVVATFSATREHLIQIPAKTTDTEDTKWIALSAEPTQVYDHTVTEGA